MNEFARQLTAVIRYAEDPHAAVGQRIGFAFSMHHPEYGDQTFKSDTQRGIVADSLEESGREREANLLRAAGSVFNNGGELRGERYPQFADYGGAEIIHIMRDGGLLCHGCANSNQHHHDAAVAGDNDSSWEVTGSDIHEEGPPATCDHCGRGIDSLYGDPDADGEE